jgi:D-alanine-D-alanine ligase
MRGVQVSRRAHWPSWARLPKMDDVGSLGIAGAVGLRVGGRPLTAGVAFGGPSPEHDVSIITGLETVRTLKDLGAISGVHALYWSKASDWYEVPLGVDAQGFIGGIPEGAAPLKILTGANGGFLVRRGRFASKEEVLPLDVVVNCCHGGPGEDGTLQGVLDLTGIPYTGPSMASAALGMDKLAFGSMVAAAWLPMLPRAPLAEDSDPPGFPGPYIVKPRFGGSSIGIEVVPDVTTARARLRANTHFRRGVVVEPYRPELFDLQIAVRVYPDLELSAIEKPLKEVASAEILGYVDKYSGGSGMVSAQRDLPAEIAADVERELRSAAEKIALFTGVRGVARIDFLSDGDALFVNEINTIPGSLSRHLWINPEISFGRLLVDLITEALNRPSVHYSVAGADGTLLQSAR